MASAKVELVRSMSVAWEHGDYGSAEWAHPDIEFVIADGPAPGRWTGLAEMARAFRDRLSPWRDIRVVIDEYRELDDERVLVLQRRTGAAKSSGIELGQLGTEGASVFYIRNGEVTKVVVYWDRERALADLGLAPDASSPG